MPQQTQWYIKNRVVVVHAYGVISDEDLAGEAQRIQELFAERDAALERGEITRQSLYVIFDASHLETIKAGLSSSMKIARVVHAHPDFRWSVIFGQRQHRLVGIMNAITSQMLNIRTRHVDTYQDALDFLSDMEAGLTFEGVNPPLLEEYPI